jgi:hypothetical protein
MKLKREYRVVMGRQVEDFINNGWELVGGVSVVSEQCSQQGNTWQETGFYQAVTRVVESDESLGGEL